MKVEFVNADIYELECILRAVRNKDITFGEAIVQIEYVVNTSGKPYPETRHGLLARRRAY